MLAAALQGDAALIREMKVIKKGGGGPANYQIQLQVQMVKKKLWRSFEIFTHPCTILQAPSKK